MAEQFDIYLTTTCYLVPDLTDFAQDIPQEHLESLSSRLLTVKPGFLGFNLIHDRAIALLKYLKSSGARADGLVASTKYRNPDAWIPLDEARKIADIAMAQLRPKYKDAKLGKVFYHSLYDHVMWYGFVASSKVWLDKGLIPGALIVSVDKLDGHVWDEAEKDAFFAENAP